MNNNLWIYDAYLRSEIVNEWICHKCADELRIKGQMESEKKVGKILGYDIVRCKIQRI